MGRKNPHTPRRAPMLHGYKVGHPLPFRSSLTLGTRVPYIAEATETAQTQESRFFSSPSSLEHPKASIGMHKSGNFSYNLCLVTKAEISLCGLITNSSNHFLTTTELVISMGGHTTSKPGSLPVTIQHQPQLGLLLQTDEPVQACDAQIRPTH